MCCGGGGRLVVGVPQRVPSPQANTWTPVASMLSRRSSAGVAVLEGALYVAGGNDGTSCLNSVERYSPKAGAWESVAPMNIRRCAVPQPGRGPCPPTACLPPRDNCYVSHPCGVVCPSPLPVQAQLQYCPPPRTSQLQEAPPTACGPAPRGFCLGLWPIWISLPPVPPPGAPTTWWPWTAGCMPWGATMAAPASTPSRNTTRGPTSGCLRPACSRGAAAWAWRCWSCSTSRLHPRPRCPCRLPASDPWRD